MNAADLDGWITTPPEDAEDDEHGDCGDCPRCGVIE